MEELAIRALAARLYERRNDAVIIKRDQIEDGDWQPDPNECHRNVTLLCNRNPDYAAVRGWLVADYVPLGLYKFFAHSIIETKTGDLIDFTPNPAPYIYPFLRHDPADGDFAEIVERQQIVWVTHQIGS